MATLFTGSVADPKGFALACQLDKGLPAEVDYMALRRDEDAHAAAALGIAPPVHLSFREAPHRGYGSAPELFSETRADDGIAADLAPALADLIAGEGPDLLLAPQAIGGHVDHVQVVRALRGLDGLPPILWWRDFPYTVRETVPREPLAGLFTRLAEPTMTLDTDAQGRKREACAAYASQIGFQFGGAAGLDARLAQEKGTERFRLSGRLGTAIPGLHAG
jgi:LmbE family N-acetylglucosaminyl deacetylase